MSYLYNLAPVALFAYARPEHTRKTVEALAANELAAETDLIIYSDAARGPMDVPAVQAVRNYLKTIGGFRSVTVHERERNFGLADSIVDGVTATVNNCGKVIVVEDDLITSLCFLRYMNNALHIYQNEECVMHVAAHMFNIDPEGLPDCFFLPPASCWGWGTWARSWRHFSCDSSHYIENFKPEDIRRFNLDDSYDYWSQVLNNHCGRMKTWAVFWYASVFANDGLCLHPRTSLVRNIGFDGSGTNCGTNDMLDFPLATRLVLDFPSQLEVNTLGLSRYESYLRKRLKGCPSTVPSLLTGRLRRWLVSLQTWVKRLVGC
ncbi:sugar transferase [Desulfomicrobium baculatum DSM 4028]|uniref:Sugar transferase n=1 Tax=Desulfomicrobium baculatum (strain DSM 4028 / VKM B-1378 / X) TaxID=525897 RepID=C7LP40_DESBD|nr:sugar transferase [Desulfomicrobium baculatum DSM 4028]